MKCMLLCGGNDFHESSDADSAPFVTASVLRNMASKATEEDYSFQYNIHAWVLTEPIAVPPIRRGAAPSIQLKLLRRVQKRGGVSTINHRPEPAVVTGPPIPRI